MIAPLLFILVVSSGINARATDQSCARLVPGLDRIAQGVDVTKLDLFHDFSIDVDDGFKNRILEYKCTEGKKWTSSFDKETYDVPDEVDSVVAMSSGIKVSDAVIMKSRADIKKSMAIEAGIEVDFLLGSFSTSTTFKTSHEAMESSNTNVATNKAYVNIASVTLAPSKFLGSSLSKHLLSELDDLPEKFNESSLPQYMAFFEAYGTHYFTKGSFGGSLSTWFTINESLSTVMDDRTINTQVNAAFKGILKVHGAITEEVTRQDERFTQASSHKERYFGGQANLFEDEGYKQWWPTIGQNPWLHTGKLVMITDMLPRDHPKKSALTDAMKVYTSRAYLIEVRHVIDAYLKDPRFSGDQFLVHASQQLDQLKERSIPDLEKLEKLEQEVDEYVRTPVWLKSSQFCFRFDGHNEQCTPPGKSPDFVSTPDRCPCPPSGEQSCSSSAQFYFKDLTPEGKAIISAAGFEVQTSHRSELVREKGVWYKVRSDL
jgi:hypothetical protein